MEAEIKPRRLRIVSGPVHLVEEELNRLLNSYVATQFSYAVVKDEVHMTVVLMHESVVRMQQIAAGGAGGRGH